MAMRLRVGARRPRSRQVGIVGVLVVALFIAFACSFALGRYPVNPVTGLRVVWFSATGQVWDGAPQVHHVIMNIRLPRLAAAMLIGLALSIAGAVLQGMFKNPLVSPDILGASAGAGLGASLAITLGFALAGIQALAFVFGLAAVLATWALGTAMRRDRMLGLVLAGIVISALMSAGTGFLKYIADPDDVLPAITFWLMGGLSDVNTAQIWFLIGPIVVASLVFAVLRWQLNVLTFGDDEASAMGVPVRTLRVVMIVLATVLTTASVCIGGLIAWVGLVIPHTARIIVGPDYRILLPASALLGALFLLIVDNLARVAFPIEIPLGLLTSVIGAPFLAILMIRSRQW